jgi:hypothetical protein
MSDAEDDRGDPPDSGSPLDGTIRSPPPAPAAALREDQVQNAVAFLSHPKVRRWAQLGPLGLCIPATASAASAASAALAG